MLKLFPGHFVYRIKWCEYFFGLWKDEKVGCKAGCVVVGHIGFPQHY